MTESIRVGFVGCGRFSGRRIYPSLRTAALELVAVCGRTRNRAEARAAEYGVTSVYDEPVKMCREEDLDAVLVVIGPRGHYEVARDLLPLGIPIWIEKPCAETSEQAGELAALALDAGVHVQVGFNYRYSLGVQKVVDLMASGDFAPPGMVAVRWWLGELDTERFLLHYACHAVDLLHFLVPGGLLGRMPEHVAQQCRDNSQWMLATFRGKDGCIAALELGTQMPGPGHWSRVELHSKDGLISIRDFTEVSFHEAAPWGDQLKPGDKPWDGDRIWRTEPLFMRDSVEQAWGYIPELIRFREAVQGKRNPEATIHEATWGMQVMDQLG